MDLVRVGRLAPVNRLVRGRAFAWAIAEERDAARSARRFLAGGDPKTTVGAQAEPFLADLAVDSVRWPPVDVVHVAELARVGLEEVREPAGHGVGVF